MPLKKSVGRVYRCDGRGRKKQACTKQNQGENLRLCRVIQGNSFSSCLYGYRIDLAMEESMIFEKWASETSWEENMEKQRKKLTAQEKWMMEITRK